MQKDPLSYLKIYQQFRLRMPGSPRHVIEFNQRFVGELFLFPVRLENVLVPFEFKDSILSNCFDGKNT